MSPLRGLFLNELFTIKALRKLRLFIRTMTLRGILIKLTYTTTKLLNQFTNTLIINKGVATSWFIFKRIIYH